MILTPPTKLETPKDRIPWCLKTFFMSWKTKFGGGRSQIFNKYFLTNCGKAKQIPPATAMVCYFSLKDKSPSSLFAILN